MIQQQRTLNLVLPNQLLHLFFTPYQPKILSTKTISKYFKFTASWHFENLRMITNITLENEDFKEEKNQELTRTL